MHSPDTQGSSLECGEGSLSLFWGLGSQQQHEAGGGFPTTGPGKGSHCLKGSSKLQLCITMNNRAWRL